MTDEDRKWLEGRLDKIVDGQTTQAVTLERNTVTLEEHVKRTALLEARFIPVEKHISMVHGVLKFIGLVSMGLSIAVAVAKLFG